MVVTTAYVARWILSQVDRISDEFEDDMPEHEVAEVDVICSCGSGRKHKNCHGLRTAPLDDADSQVLEVDSPCQCGSGRKYKNCHGLSMARTSPSGAVAVDPNARCHCGAGRSFKNCHGLYR